MGKVYEGSISFNKEGITGAAIGLFTGVGTEKVANLAINNAIVPVGTSLTSRFLLPLSIVNGLGYIVTKLSTGWQDSQQLLDVLKNIGDHPTMVYAHLPNGQTLTLNASYVNENLNQVVQLIKIIEPTASHPTISGNSVPPNENPVRSLLSGPWNSASAGTVNYIDPLMLDLDGNGVQTTSLANSSTFFDMDANGYAEHTAWVSAGDGILFQDLNHDGMVTDGSELFGPQLLTDGQTSLGVDGTDGFTALAALDSNSDGKIDASDSGFADLKVVKGDGTVYTLAQLGITSLNLTHATNFTLDSSGALPSHTHEQLASWTDASGNLVQAIGSYTKADGSTATMDSYLLNRDPMSSIEPEQVSSVSDSIANLPYVNGMGNISDLYTVMSKDPTGQLENLVLSFVNEADTNARTAIVQNILTQWAGTTDVDPASRGSYINGQNLATLEKFLGQVFPTDQPSLVQAQDLDLSYYYLREYIYSQLDVQTHLSDLMSFVKVVTDPLSGAATYDFSGVASYIQNLLNSPSTESQGEALMGDFARVVRGLNIEDSSNYQTAVFEYFNQEDPNYGWILNTSGKNMVTSGLTGSDIPDVIVGTNNGDYIEGNAGCDAIQGQGGNDNIYGEDGNDYLDGGDGNDSIVGGRGNDTVFGGLGNDNLSDSGGTEGSDNNYFDGGSGNDSITAGYGNDTLIGGTGDDTINGAGGDDTYVFNLGDGNDTVRDDNDPTNQGNDTIQFGADIDQSDVTFMGSGVDLRIIVDTDGPSGNAPENIITIQEGLEVQNIGSTPGATYHIENYQFLNDGTVYSYDYITSHLVSNQVNASGYYSGANFYANTEYGASSNDYLAGGYVNDTLYGEAGNDDLWGNTGDDVLIGGSGNDRLEGDVGNDTYVFDSGFGIDTINDSSGSNTLDVSAFSGNQAIDLSSATNFTSGSDSVSWSAGNIENVITGSGNDTLTGDSADNTLTGGAGNDSLSGGLGNDTYQFASGFGLDTVTDSLGSNTLDFSAFTSNLSVDVSATSFTESTGNTVTWTAGDINNLTLGSGDDTLTGSTENNTLAGGSGDDTYVFSGSFGQDTVVENTDEGVDTVDLSAVTAALAVNLTSGTGDEVSDGTNGVNWSGDNVENVIAGSGDDSITGSSGDNVLTGNAGNDSLVGGTGNDTYVFAGSFGQDTVVENTDEGTDTVDLSGVTADLTVNLTSGAGDEVTDGTNTVNWSGDNIENAIAGSGNDSLAGSASDNQLTGGAGNDTLAGGTGNDTYVFAGSFGKDTMVENSSEGTDTLDLSALTADLTVNLTTSLSDEVTDGTNTINWTGDNVENAIAGSGNDTITGNAGDNVLTGNGGNDSLVGGDGNDTYVFASNFGVDTISDASGSNTLDFSANDATQAVSINLTSGTSFTQGSNTVNWTLGDIRNITTGAGNDALVGSSVGNQLVSGDGNDTLTSGSGNDLLSGGSGDDTYVLATGFAQDTIEDASGSNTLDLSGISSNISMDLTSATTFTDGSNTANWSTVGVIRNIIGGSGNDNLTGDANDNLLAGGSGDDSLSGGDGNDTYQFSNGWGVDTITDSASDSSTNTVDFSGVTSALTLTLSSGSGDEASDGTNTVNWADDAIANATGGSGNDTMTGSSGDNWLIGGAGDDSLDGSDGNDTLDGGTGANTLIGGSGDDVYIFAPGFGTDSVSDTAGTDTFDLSSFTTGITIDLASTASLTDGTSTVNWTAGDIENFITGSGNDSLTAGSSDAILIAGDGNNTLISGTGNDTLVGGTGDDLYQFSGNWGKDYLSDSAGVNMLDFTGTTAALSMNLDASSGNEVSDGTNLINWDGNLIQNVTAGSGDDVILATADDNSLMGAAGNDSLSGFSGNDTLEGSSGDDTLVGGDGNDSLIGGADNDVFFFANHWGNDSISDTSGTDTVDLSNVTTDLTVSLTSDDTSGIAEVSNGTNTIDWSSNAIENVLTGSGNDTVVGNTNDNSISSGAGNDTLDGGTGADTLAGGQGDDTYLINNTGVTINENTGEGIDTVQASLSYTLGANLDHLILSGTSDLTGTGNTLANVLTGNSGNNTLDGDAGADTLIGGAGDDTYIVDNTADTIIENAGEGTELVQASVSYALSDNIENLTLTGASDISATGNALANVLTGNTGNNTLDGDFGADTLIGGTGDDTYLVDDAGDLITENSAEGTDTVQASFSYTLGINLENLTLTGTSDLSGTGNSLANVLTGNSGNNTLDGDTGADTLIGGVGNDTYIVDNMSDTITENSGEGTDTVQAGVSYTLGSNIENLVLTGTGNIDATGNTLDNTLTGNSGNNVLSGDAGSDTYTGFGTTAGADTINDASGSDDTANFTGYETTQVTWAANDSNADGNVDQLIVDFGSGNSVTIQNYFDNTNALVTNSGAGTGLIEHLAFDDNANVDFATIQTLVQQGLNLTGTSGDDHLIGAGFNDTLSGLAGNDTLDGDAGSDSLDAGAGDDSLDGGIGADTLIGGIGNDIYYVDNTSDVVSENVGEGTDTVYSSVTYTLGSNVENLVLTGSSNINGTGNSLNNQIIGNTGNNTLDGGTGADTLTGGTGDDAYVVDNAIDVVTENPDEGTDTVLASINYTLGSDVENLTLTGNSNLNGTGNSLDNVLTGSTGNNVLDAIDGNDTLNGGAGDDSLLGGAGNDTYSFNTGFGTDTITDTSGTDTIDFSAFTTSIDMSLATTSYTESTGNIVNWTSNAIENLTTGSGDDSLTGSTGNNVLDAGNGNDTLSGGTGNDTLDGGAGNDTYEVSAGTSSATIIDSAGTDTLDFSGYTQNVNVDLTATSADLAFVPTTTNKKTLFDINDQADNSTIVSDYYGNAWTAYGNAKVSSTNPWLAGEKSYAFDGSGDYLKSTAVKPDGNNFTVDLRVRFDSVSSPYSVLLSSTNTSFELRRYAGGLVVCLSSNGSTWNIANVVAGSKTNWTAGQWYNIEFSYSSTEGYKVFVDGTLDYSTSTTTKLYNPGGLIVGANAVGSYGLNGAVSDFYFNDEETLHDANFTPASTGWYDQLGGTVDWSQASLENVLGGSGDDSLTGTTGDNVLSGGTGNDTLDGGAGNDIYAFNLGDGQDLVQDSSGTDKVLFNSSVNLSNVIVYQSGSDLEIGYTDNTTDVITIQGQNSSSTAVESFQLSTGQYMTAAEINSIIAQMSTYAASNSISITSLDDVRNNTNLVQIVNSGWHS